MSISTPGFIWKGVQVQISKLCRRHFLSSLKPTWIIFKDTIVIADFWAGLSNSKMKFYKVKELNKWKFAWDPTPKLLLFHLLLYLWQKKNYRLIISARIYLQKPTEKTTRNKEIIGIKTYRPKKCEWSAWGRAVSFLEEAVNFSCSS